MNLVEIEEGTGKLIFVNDDELFLDDTPVVTVRLTYVGLDTSLDNSVFTSSNVKANWGDELLLPTFNWGPGPHTRSIQRTYGSSYNITGNSRMDFTICATPGGPSTTFQDYYFQIYKNGGLIYDDPLPYGSLIAQCPSTESHESIYTTPIGSLVAGDLIEFVITNNITN